MSGERNNTAQLQAVLTSLLEHQLGSSLEQAHGALERWRGGELTPFEAHAALLEHAARAERLATRLARIGPAGARSALRDAFDAGLIDRGEFVSLAGCEPDEVEPSPPLDSEAGASSPAPPKRELVDELLEQGPVLVHVDARRPEVSVPERFRGDPRLVLRFGYGLSPAIVDLTVDDDGISGTLTFGGMPHHCVLPWSAVYAAVSESDQRGMVWPEDVPPEVIEQQARGESEDSAEGADAGPKRPDRPRHLKLVE